MADVHLTQRDIDYIARVVDTEVPRSLAYTNPAEYERMVQGVVDTITNRTSSTQFPSTPVGVMNQDRQFSKISGPDYLNPYGSVQNAPRASERAQAAVYDYVASRAQGAPATVGGAMNYANPNYSSKSNLSSWIDPMVEAGAQMFGVGNSVHYHGNAPGIDPADPYSLTAEAMPSGSIPTPTFRDDVPGQRSSATGIMAAIDPATPMSVERGLLGEIDPMAVEMAFSAPSIAAPGFDMGRFGPEPQTPANAFDYGRFGAPPTTQTAFDQSRFATNAPVAQGLAGLQRGLLDQQLAVGILPSIPAPVDPTRTATVTQPVYRDPAVTVQPPARQPVAPRAAPAQPIGKESRVSSAAQPQASFMGRNNPALRDMSPGTKGLLGGIGSAILGGALLGPVGAAIGGLLGNSYFGNPSNHYPSAPDPIAGQSDPGYGYGSLGEYGQQAYNESQNFRDAVDSGKPGLW
jgi:hypothetical protein